MDGRRHAGADDAFAALVRPHRRELHAHCYRMLGSVDDADDVLQEVLVRAWRGLEGFEGRSALRTWLFRIATNACLTRLARRPPRTLPLDHAPTDIADDTPWLGPYPDRLLLDDPAGRPDAVAERLESIEIAFVAALQHLPARSRAVLILRAVLDHSAQETADALGMTVPAVNSALQRARTVMRARVGEGSQQEALRRLGDERVRQLLRRYMRATEEADVAGLLSLLHEDVTWCMPPMAEWYRGKEAVAALLAEVVRERWRHLVTAANGQPAVGCYRWDDGEGAWAAAVLDVLSFRGDRIMAVTAFVDPAVLGLCGLPDRLPPGPG